MPQLRHLQAGVLRLPLVVRGLGDAVLAAGLDDLRPGFDFLEDPDDLFFGETRLLHAELLGWELYFQLARINEDASALHIEHGFPYSDAGTAALEKFVASNAGDTFSFESPSALQNMPWHPSASEISEARSLIASMSDESLRDSLTLGTLRDYYVRSPRSRERMGALACALIDRGLAPRLADITGSLYVE